MCSTRRRFCLLNVSEMIQSSSAQTIACGFLSDRSRARAGARMVKSITEKRTGNDWRGYYDCAISLAARYAVGRQHWLWHSGSSQQTADTDRAHIIFRARRRDRPSARLLRKPGKLQKKTELWLCNG